MKTAAIIPVKTFARAKTRLDVPDAKRTELCRCMLEEILRTVAVSPRIDRMIVVTGDAEASRMAEGFGATVIPDDDEEGVNQAVALADRHLADEGYDASIVLPQDIPYVKTQDIDFVMNHAHPPDFAIVVPSQRFDGTNALVRMPVDLMGTRYDEGSYKAHMSAARERTGNAALVFARRIMWDVDTLKDLEFLLANPEKPDLASRIREILDA